MTDAGLDGHTRGSEDSSERSATVIIERMDGGPRLVIEDALRITETFLRQDGGARAFDARAGQGDANRIETADIAATNQMRAHSRYTAWEALMPATGPLPVLAAIDTDVGLFDLDDRAWADGWSRRIEDLLAAGVGPYRRLSIATKTLHLKRPRLIPVLDSLVVQQMGGGRRKPIKLVDHLRRVGIANREELEAIAGALEAAGTPRTPVRILDILLWATHPAASLNPSLGAFERRIMLVPPGTERPISTTSAPVAPRAPTRAARATPTPTDGLIGSKSARMRQLFDEGKTVAEVAKIVGVSYPFAYGVAKRAGKAKTAARRRPRAD